MDFALTDEQRTLVRTLRDFIARELAPLEDEVERTGVLPAEVAAAIHEKVEGARPLRNERPVDASAAAVCPLSTRCWSRSSSAARPTS